MGCFRKVFVKNIFSKSRPNIRGTSRVILKNGPFLGENYCGYILGNFCEQIGLLFRLIGQLVNAEPYKLPLIIIPT